MYTTYPDAHNSIVGNVIQSSRCAFGIVADYGGRTSITGNTLEILNESTTGISLSPGVDRCSVTGNTISVLGNTGAGIHCAGAFNVISNNTLECATTVAILLPGNNNVVGFNVSGAVTPVSDLGTSNEVAHNI